MDYLAQGGLEREGRADWGRARDTPGSEHRAHGLCFPSSNCSVNHCNKLFPAPHGPRRVGLEAKKCLEMSFLCEPRAGGPRMVSRALVEELEEKVGGWGSCVGQEVEGDEEASLPPGSPPPSPRRPPRSFTSLVSFYPLSFRHASHSRSELPSRPLLAQLREGQHGRSSAPSPFRAQAWAVPCFVHPGESCQPGRSEAWECPLRTSPGTEPGRETQWADPRAGPWAPRPAREVSCAAGVSGCSVSLRG